MDSTYDELNHVLGRQQSENGDYFDPSTFVLVQQVEESNGGSGGTMAPISGVAGREGAMAAISPAVAQQQQESSNCFGGTIATPISSVPQQYEDSNLCFGGETLAMSAVSQQEKAADDRFGGKTRASTLPAFFSSAPQQEQVTDDPFGGAKTNASAIQQEASYQCFPVAIVSTSVIPQQEIVSDDGFGSTAASNHCFGGATPSIFTIPQRQQSPPQQATMYDGFGGSTMTNIIPAVPAQEAETNPCFQSPMATASTIPQQQGGTDDRSGGATTADIFEVSDREAAAAANGDDMSSASWLEEILQDDTTEQQHSLAFDAQNQELPELTDQNYSQYNQSANLATGPQTQSITTQSPPSQRPQHVADAIRSQNLIMDSQALQYTDTGASCQDSTAGFGVSSSSGDIPQEQLNTEIEQTTLEEIRRNKRKQQNREAQRRLRKKKKARIKALEEENQKLKERNLLLENQCNAAVALTNSLRAQVMMKDDLINRYISGRKGKFLAQAYQAC